MFFGTLKSRKMLQFVFLSLTVLFALYWQSVTRQIMKVLQKSRAGLV